MITELRLLDDNGETLFNESAFYIIPLYQRAYAWKEKHIEQLIDDIKGKEEGVDYYLGSLIVNRNGQGQFEVIDGQQRLTTLFLLFHCLGIKVSKSLSFACRDASQKTLENLNAFIMPSDYSLKLMESEQEQHIIEGIKTIQNKFKTEFNDEQKTKFIEKLHHVLLYRIELPEHTDLNRYFEIMNTRGEQLEPHDIVKARLMSYLQDDTYKRDIFAEIWEACSNMEGYVQMNMGPELRRLLFGGDWGNLPNINDKPDSQSKDRAGDTKDKTGDTKELPSIEDIITKEMPKGNKVPADEYASDRHRRYESIITFPNFLLHVLRIFKNDNSGGLLDDRKLLEDYDNAVKDFDGTQADFSWGFIKCLLKCRFLFDKYILKRQFLGDDTIGRWSINELKKSTSNTPYYVETVFGNEEVDKNIVAQNTNNIMLQSCMRVTYTSPKIMHWITTVLRWLYDNNCSNLKRIGELAVIEEDFIRRSVQNDFLSQGDFERGVETPNLVFNYLDYLLWKDDTVLIDGKESFIFEFRNSVEHWYPQNPSDKTFDRWDKVDRFGNLCIIQRSVNSRFSNMSPCAKKDTYGNKAASQSMIWNGSLKLRLMAEATHDDNSWREKDCEDHEEKMLKILREACSKITTPEKTDEQTTAKDSLQVVGL